MFGFDVEFLIALIDAWMWYGIAAVELDDLELAGVDDDVGMDSFHLVIFIHTRSVRYLYDINH